MRPKRHIDLSGRKFARITVLELAYTDKRRRTTYWKCKCACGSVFLTRVDSLRSGHSKSCGCLQRESARELNFKHGKTGTRAFTTWDAMWARCINPRSVSYGNYGGRGIRVCDRWRIFSNFYADMGDKPGGTYIERIDNNGNYEPSNCRWATAKEQHSNKRTNRWIAFNGITLTLDQWAGKTGIRATTIHKRLNRGWPLETALTEASRRS